MKKCHACGHSKNGCGMWLLTFVFSAVIWVALFWVAGAWSYKAAFYASLALSVVLQAIMGGVAMTNQVND